jgi:hydroxylaminobenzene mutase
MIEFIRSRAGFVWMRSRCKDTHRSGRWLSHADAGSSAPTLVARVFLFLLGLITGLAIPIINNHRMGLSAHLEALLNGILLLALGCLWPQLKLSARALNATFWLALYGTYANWFFTLLGAILGTKALTPQAGAGFNAAPLSEIVVGIGLVTLATVMVIVCVILLIGLSGKAATSSV